MPLEWVDWTKLCLCSASAEWLSLPFSRSFCFMNRKNTHDAGLFPASEAKYHFSHSFIPVNVVPCSSCRYPFPTVFSTCSKKDLAASLEKGVGMCLYNMPEVKVLYGGQKCGNGYVEEGEECDCGEPEVKHSSSLASVEWISLQHSIWTRQLCITMWMCNNV